MAYHHHYHHIDSAEDEARLLKHIIQLETQVRAKRERERLSANSESDRYSKIFEPITQSMKSIHDAVTTTMTTKVTPRKRARSSSAAGNDDRTPAARESGDDDDHQEINDGRLVEKKEEVEGEETDDDPARVVQHVLSKIKHSQRDDGVFGLNWAKKTIGAYPFQVDGNNLQVQTGDNEWEIFQITMDDVWKMLLLQNPANKVHTKTQDGGLTPAAKQYKDIVQKLDLVQHAQKTRGAGYKKRVKYKDIIAIAGSSGTGFFYSLQQPSSFIKRKKTGSGIQKDGSPPPPQQQSPPLSPCQTKKKKRLQKFSPETVVIPSDKKGLLCALVRAMAELKAGNTSMRNLVVPLALEAKRRGILPKEYSNDVDNLNWIYA